MKSLHFRNWGIKTKIMSILFISIVVITVAVETIIVPLTQHYFMNDRQLATRYVVEVAYNILVEHAERARAGRLTTEEAKAQAIALIRTLRFSGSEYFWIHDLGRPIPRMIMHPTVPALDGRLLDDPGFNRASGKRSVADKEMTPVDNTNLFVTMNQVVNNSQEGYVSYRWPKPVTDGTVTTELYPKISFVKKYEPWGWVIGSGIYVDDVKEAVGHIRRLIHTASILFCIAALMIYSLLVRYISRPVINIALMAKRLATGEYSDELPQATTCDEVGLLSESLNHMSHQVRQKSLDLETANQELKQELAERKRAEESLRASEEKFRTLVNNSFDVIFVLNRDGVFTFVSPSWETHFGHPVDSVVGRSFEKFVHPDDVGHCFEYLEQVMGNNQAVTSRPYRVNHDNGSWCLFIANGTLHHDPNGAPLYIGVGRDISDEKRLEEERLHLERQFLHAQKLESLGIMAGGIAHDFNNLLAVIIGNLELSAMHLDKDSPVVTRLGRAMQASRRAADITQQMLAYSGNGLFELRQLNINQLLQEHCNLLHTTIPKNITLTLELADTIPSVMVDAGQLQQAIVNLITNAAEAIGNEPGIISVTTTVQEWSEQLLRQSRLGEKARPGWYVTIEITDNGCGMDEETQQRIFEPFFTTKFTGRGLGMSSVIGIIKAHDGTIMLHSRPDHGSIFKVLLPVCDTTPHSVLQDSTDKSLFKQDGTFDRIVLVVDDEELVREVSLELIIDMGLKTLGAANGAEAINIFKQNRDKIGLVILDMTMPHMDGVATLRELRLIRPDIRVVISSGHATEATSRFFVTDKPDDYIQKPFQMKELSRVITG